MSTIDRTQTTAAPAARVRGAFRQDRYAPYFFISPFYILFTVFFLFPTVFALVLSFMRWSSLGTPEFFGLRNYQHLFADPVFWKSVSNTVFYAAVSLGVIVPLALLEALALNSKLLLFRTLWRVVYFAPIVCSTVAVALVFRMLYNKDFGVINQILLALGGLPVDWTGNVQIAKFAVMGVVIWRWTGLLAVYFLAGLQSIPEELHEAAAIDGANTTQRFFYVTLPLLRPVLLFVCVIVLIGSMQIFDDPQLLTGGGPANATLSIVQYLYVQGISNLLFGFASAVGLFLFVVIFSLSLLQFRVFRGFGTEPS
jgi:multiple sugar transport system permease protein